MRRFLPSGRAATDGALIAAPAASRLLPHPPNFTPLAAMALLSGARLSSASALAVPLAAMLASDSIIGLHDQMPAVYLAFALTVGLGRLLRRRGPLLWNTLLGDQLYAVAVFGGLAVLERFLPARVQEEAATR
jgi:hypothetical protein